VKFTEKTRATIRERADNRCEICGLNGANQIHHRKPRGMGGTKNVESRSAANGLFVHLKCHDRIEKNRDEGYRNGWLVHQWEKSEDVPVKMFDGWKTLSEDGKFSSLSPR